jgi:hypothetical protein
MESDIETLLMGRMPSLKAFYIVDPTIVFWEGPWEPGTTPHLSRPFEVFEGHNCKFVEVDPDDEAWDLDPLKYPRHHSVHNPNPFTSFMFADKLRRVVWRQMAIQHARGLIEAARADDPYAAPPSDLPHINFDPPVGPAELADAARIPNDKYPLDVPELVLDDDNRALTQLQMPYYRKPPSRGALKSEFPDSLLAVQIKVMTRVEPKDYWRLTPPIEEEMKNLAI